MTNIKHSLNLTTANRVFIIEPQWNPSVENQAVARAIRMNQTKSVLVTRYIIKATVEQVHCLRSTCIAISDRM
jgi:SNF2 family DNA or RNA helicase